MAVLRVSLMTVHIVSLMTVRVVFLMAPDGCAYGVPDVVLDGSYRRLFSTSRPWVAFKPLPVPSRFQISSLVMRLLKPAQYSMMAIACWADLLPYQ